MSEIVIQKEDILRFVHKDLHGIPIVDTYARVVRFDISSRRAILRFPPTPYIREKNEMAVPVSGDIVRNTTQINARHQMIDGTDIYSVVDPQRVPKDIIARLND